MLLLLSEELAVVDNLSGKLYLIVYAALGEAGTTEVMEAAEAYKAAKKRLKELLANLRKSVEIPVEAPSEPAEVVSEFNEADFIEAVERAKRYIFDGDIMQVVYRNGPANLIVLRHWRFIAHYVVSILRHTCFIITLASFTWLARRRKSWCVWNATP